MKKINVYLFALMIRMVLAFSPGLMAEEVPPLRIDENGNVGIGTSAPNAKLDVRGTGKLNFLELNRANDNNNYISGKGNPYIYSSRNDGSGYPFDDLGHLILQSRSDDDGLDIILATGSPPTQRIVVKGSGNVGIGTTDPSEALDVAGTVKATAFLGNGSGLTGLPGSPWTTESGGIYYDGGKVGIGTAEPEASLDVNGDIRSNGVIYSQKIQSRFGQMIGYGPDDGFTYKEKSMSWYAFGVQNDPWNTGSGTVWITGFGGIKLFTGGQKPAMSINYNGKTTISASLDVKGSKNFRIPHPLKEGKDLVHSSLEGPEISVFYRGEGRLNKGVTTIELPDYFEALTRTEGRTVQLTSLNGWSPLYVEGKVENARFTVKSENGKHDQEFYWEVKAVRNDIPPLGVEVDASE